MTNCCDIYTVCRKISCSEGVLEVRFGCMNFCADRATGNDWYRPSGANDKLTAKSPQELQRPRNLERLLMRLLETQQALARKDEQANKMIMGKNLTENLQDEER